MKFCEKLDFLMKLTSTSNSTLALHSKIDASYISRLRRGERSAPKNEFCIKAMAAYFAKHCEHDYQQKALTDMLRIAPGSYDEAELTELISQWLSDSRKESATVECLLSRIANLKSKQMFPEPGSVQDEARAECHKSEVSIYYGIDGKRQAAIDFLTDILAKDKPVTLLLLSEEATDWMAEDREFAVKWASMMVELVSKGSKIKIIHTLNRDLDEMLRGISQWLPLYMTGTIEPYYYPKKRDGVFKRTLFIASNFEAVVSSSVGSSWEQSANVLFRDKAAVAAFEREFDEYLSLCRPLMSVFTPDDRDEYLDTLMRFEEVQSNSVIRTESLSLVTMPEDVVRGVVSRLEETKHDFLQYALIRNGYFKQSIESYSFTEIIPLYDIETVKNGEVKVAFSDILVSKAVYYTPEEYILHLENIKKMLETYKNFHVCFERKAYQEEFAVYVKEDVGVFVTKTSQPPVTIACGEDNLKAAFWDYMMNIIEAKFIGSRSNEEAVKRLKVYIGKIRESISTKN